MAAYNNITVKAYGKLNLLLEIAGRQSDGYHVLNTVMQSVSCYDLLDISLQQGSGIEIICNKEGFPCDETNLIYKACTSFQEFTGIDFGGKISVKVEKNLPSMAGMGGGSADCAAMLTALNVMYNTFLDEEKLCEIGVKSGADVPFCITGGTRLCQGIGDKIHKLITPECYFVVIKPDVSISTAEAYRRYDALENHPCHSTDMFLKALASGNIYSICLAMNNVLELALESEKEEIDKAKQVLMKQGALTSLMTGSGSAVFGVFTDKESAEYALNCIHQEENYSYAALCEPVKKGCEIISRY